MTASATTEEYLLLKRRMGGGPRTSNDNLQANFDLKKELLNFLKKIEFITTNLMYYNFGI